MPARTAGDRFLLSTDGAEDDQLAFDRDQAASLRDALDAFLYATRGAGR